MKDFVAECKLCESRVSFEGFIEGLILKGLFADDELGIFESPFPV